MSKSPTSQPRKPKRRYVLTKTGKHKLEEKYEHLSDSKIEDMTGINRGTIGKIRNGYAGVNKKSLVDLFKELDIRWEDNYCEEFNQPPQQSCRKPSRTSSNKDDLIPNETMTEKLKNALRELNYQDQESSFIDIVRMESAIAFLIHGESGYGQRWLVNRLSYKVPHYTDALCCSLQLKRRHRNNIQTLWEDLAPMVGITTPSPQDIVKAIYQHWQTQTVMLCFRDVDVVTKEEINQLLQKLWQPLVTMVRAANSPENEDQYRLLLFLIDNLGIPLASRLDPSRTDTPIELKRLEPFRNEEIRRWVSTQTQLFKPQLQNPDTISDIINDIIARNSTPVNALDGICKWCDLDSYQDIEMGLAL